MTSLDDLHAKNVIQTAKKIIADVNHPLNNNYVLLRSGRRLVVPTQNTDRFGKSFVPISVKLYNDILGT